MVKIISALEERPEPIGELAKKVGVGWKTCERYLESLKKAGIVAEVRTPKERLFLIRQRSGPRLLVVPRAKVGLTFKFLDEAGPRPSDVEDLT